MPLLLVEHPLFFLHNQFLVIVRVDFDRLLVGKIVIIIYIIASITLRIIFKVFFIDAVMISMNVRDHVSRLLRLVARKVIGCRCTGALCLILKLSWVSGVDATSKLLIIKGLS